MGEPTGTGPDTITGQMLIDKLLYPERLGRADELAGISCVMCTPGSRTYWHSHSGGQVFFVSEGSGMIATRDGDCRRIQAGDVAYAPAGEVHWHGASADAFVVYTVVSHGPAEWFEEVTDEDYAHAFRD
jgi:quercetin dioxygenase-like cupin family protein